MRPAVKNGVVVAASLLALTSYKSREAAYQELPKASADADPELKSESLPEAASERKYSDLSIESLSQRIRLDVVQFSELSPAEKNDPQIIIAALSSSSSKEDALIEITLEHFKNPAIKTTFLKQPGLIFSLGYLEMSEVVRELLKDKEIISVLTKNCIENPSSISKLSQGIKEYCPPEVYQEILSSARPSVIKLLKGGGQHVLSFFVLEEYGTDREIASIVYQDIMKAPSEGKLFLLHSMNLTSMEITSALNNAVALDVISESAKFGYAPLEMLKGEYRAGLLEAIVQGERSALGSVSVNSELLEDQEIRDAIIESCRARPELIDAITSWNGSGVEHEFSKFLVETVYSDPAFINKVVETVKTDITAVVHYPKHLLRTPEVAHAIRLTINELVERGPLPKKEKDHLFFLISSLVEPFPEVLNLTRSGEGFKLIFPQYLTFNPRAASYREAGTIISEVHKIDNKLLSAERYLALACVVEAGEILGIRELRRFDNAREILRNRYAIVPAEVKFRLEKALGKRYFEGAVVDDRPVSFIVGPSKESDHNGAFLARNFSDPQNMIDKMMSKYQVFYFECETGPQAIRAAIDTAERTGKSLPFLILGGHGDGKSISLGWKNLTREDRELIALLGEYIAKGGRIYLESCSAAAELEDGDNIARILHEEIPHAHITGPAGTTGIKCLFAKDGEFEGFHYLFARQVDFAPDGSIETEGRIPCIARSSWETASRMFFKLKNDLTHRVWHEPLSTIQEWLFYLGGSVIFVSGLQMGTRVISNSVRGVRKLGSMAFGESESEEPQKERQLLLFDDM